jgi:hypothetical protein
MGLALPCMRLLGAVTRSSFRAARRALHCSSTQYVGQQPKGHWGNSGNTGGDLHGRRQEARKGARRHERSGWKTDAAGGAEKHQHARCEATREGTRSARTGDGGRTGGIGGSTSAFGCGLRGGGGLQAKCRLGGSACGGTPLRSRRPSGPKTPISNMIYDILHITLHFLRHSGLGECETKANACYVLYYFGRAWSGLHLHCGVWLLFSC